MGTRGVIGAWMVLACLVTASATVRGLAQDDGWAPFVARSEQIVDQLVAGDTGPVVEQFNDKMKAAVPPEQLRQLFATLATQVGAFKARTGTRTEMRQGMRVALVSCQFERATLDMQIAFDATDRIAGLRFVPSTAGEAWTAPSYVTSSAFRSEDVVVDAGGWPLPGTLTLPVAGGPVPGVVLVHGSGPGDRDQAMGSNRPFRDLAEGLASRGIAVLRYDKRTRVHAARSAAVAAFTVRDEVIDDVVAAVKKLRETPGVRADRVFVIGHSLGGMLAPRIAEAAPDLAGLIVMAGAARPLETAILEQSRYMAMLDGSITPPEQAQLDELEKVIARVRALAPGDASAGAPLLGAPPSYWLDLRGYDAPTAAARLDLPMLVLQGERDYQVTMADLESWRRAVGGRANVRIVTYPSLNHHFMSGSGPATPAEYLQPGHVDEAVVRDIAAWIAER